MRAAKTIGLLLTSMLTAGLGYVVSGGFERWDELTGVQAVAGIGLVVLSPLLSWLAEDPSSAGVPRMFRRNGAPSSGGPRRLP